MELKNGIYIKYSELQENNFWFIMAHADGQIKYLHRNGQWLDSCFNPFKDKESEDLNYQGHYTTKEEAIGTVKKYTKFIMIYDKDENEEYI